MGIEIKWKTIISLGWAVLVIWECQIKNDSYIKIIENFLEE